MAGEIADGVVLNYCVPPEYNDRAFEFLARGAGRVGRNLDDLDKPQLVVCSVDKQREKAINSTRMLLTQYLAQQPHIAKASGVAQEVVAEIQTMLGWPATKEQINRAKHLVPDELIYRITASGTPEEAREGRGVPETWLHLPDSLPGGWGCQVIGRHLRGWIIIQTNIPYRIGRIGIFFL